ncbi:MAG: hypothetical protein ACO3SP_04910 [Ilumatobacteraceae bacterium]
MSEQTRSDVRDPVMGYHGAIDDRCGCDVVAPDILQLPFWTPDLCREVIDAAEAVGGFAARPEDPVPGFEISLAAISGDLFEDVENDFGERIWPQLQEVWPLIDYYGLRDAFIIKYSMDAQTSLRIHHDVAQVSGSVKLNDGYEGAQLDFPRQSFDNSSVSVGALLAWPSLVTHPHQTLPLISGVKYGLTIWCELPEQYQ